MITTNDQIAVTVDPRILFAQADMHCGPNLPAKIVVTLGEADAADQLEDILNKFTMFDSEFKTLLWQHINNFVCSHGYKIVEAGGVVPQ